MNSQCTSLEQCGIQGSPPVCSPYCLGGSRDGATDRCGVRAGPTPNRCLGFLSRSAEPEQLKTTKQTNKQEQK